MGGEDARRPENLQVLVVDDSSGVREAASRFLSEAGFSVTTVGDGFEGLAMFTQNTPDMVMADIMLPGIDGYQLCSLIKTHPEYSRIPVIMLSGKDALLDETRAKLAGSDFCINKPFSSLAITNVARQFTADAVGSSHEASGGQQI